MSLVLAVVAATAVHLLLVDGPFPWRVGDLEPRPAAGAAPAVRRRRGRGHRPCRGRACTRLAGAARRRSVDRGPSPSSGPTGRRDRRARARSVDADLARCADLLVVAALAGHGVHGALSALAELDGAAGGSDPGARPVGAALVAAVAEHGRGRHLAAALDGVVEQVGPAVRPLVAALQSTLAAGTPLVPSLQRISDSGRARHRHRVQAQVRRLPVLLLLPLVALVLPAFALVTLVPVGVATARVGAELALSPSPVAPPHRGPRHAS